MTRTERSAFKRGIDLGLVHANVFGGPFVLGVGLLITSWLLVGFGALMLVLGLVAWRYEGWRWTP